LSHTPPTQPTHHHHYRQRPAHDKTPTHQPQQPGPTRRGTPQHRPTNSADSGHTRLVMHTRHNYKDFDARVHYPDLKQQPHTQHRPANQTSPHGPGTKQPHPTTPTSSRPAPTRTGSSQPPANRDGRGSDSSEPQQCAPTHQTRTNHTPPQTGECSQPRTRHRAGRCR